MRPTFLAVMLLLVGCVPVEQSSPCAQYVSCIGARDRVLDIETDVARFDAGGACWGGAEGAELCTSACENGLAFLASDPAASDLPECAP